MYSRMFGFTMILTVSRSLPRLDARANSVDLYNPHHEDFPESGKVFSKKKMEVVRSLPGDIVPDYCLEGTTRRSIDLSPIANCPPPRGSYSRIVPALADWISPRARNEE